MVRVFCPPAVQSFWAAFRTRVSSSGSACRGTNFFSYPRKFPVDSVILTLYTLGRRRALLRVIIRGAPAVGALPPFTEQSEHSVVGTPESSSPIRQKSEFQR